MDWKNLADWCSSRWKKAHFPSNILITAPHASARVPLSVYQYLTPLFQTSPRLLLNFSDYSTRRLMTPVPEQQAVRARWSRLIGDCNRSLDSEDLWRFLDFNDQPIFRGKFTSRLESSWLRLWWRQRLLKLSYEPFFQELKLKLLSLRQDPRNSQRPLWVVDLHDVGTRLLGINWRYDRQRSEFKIPPFSFANAPDSPLGTTCPWSGMQHLAQTLAEKLEVPAYTAHFNEPYVGGHVIRQVQEWSEKDPDFRALQNQGPIYSLQLEFDRSLYLNEATQRPFWMRLWKTRSALLDALWVLSETEG